jgi:NAD(P)H-dependent FMN reductase
MNTLVFFGSPRKDGNTKVLLDDFLAELDGTVELIDAYQTQVAPCKDCRHCWQKRECSIDDEMQEIYEKIDAADNIVIAAPIYFHSLPAPLKMIIDRCQVYWASVLRDDSADKEKKTGALLMCAGAPPFAEQFLAGELVLEGLLSDLGAECLGKVEAANTDEVPVSDNDKARQEAKSLAAKVNDY